MPITEVLSRNARLFPSETALVEREPLTGKRREISWLDFDRLANQFAHFLLARGLGRGDRAAILMMNCLEWLPVYFGILKTGALAVPINFRFSAPEIKNCLDTVGAKILVFGPELKERVEEIKDQVPTVECFIYIGEDSPVWSENFGELTAGKPDNDPQVEIDDTQEAALYFSSGTTGSPKPIIITHANLVAAAVTEKKHHLQSRKDNFLCIPPLYHTGAKMHWFGSLLAGSKAVILRGVKPQWILEAVSEENVTIVWLLVPWAQDILDAVESGEVKLTDYRLNQWRLMHIGAQPVPPSLIWRWKKYFPHQQYDTNYGLSEATGPGCVHLGLENTHKVGAIGVPGYRWEVKIVDEGGNPVKNGSVGELIVRGPGVMKGYYNNPEATAQALKDGWLYTGDMARMDDDGFIYLVDRKKDIVICGGENIFPVEVEDHLRAHEDIKDAAVIGMPDVRLGEIPVAVVELKPGRNTSEEDIIRFCEALPRYKRPRRIFFGEVPRNPTGKIEKPRLREKYCGKKEAVLAEGCAPPEKEVCRAAL